MVVECTTIIMVDMAGMVDLVVVAGEFWFLALTLFVAFFF
jgi:hypothetical protein